MNVGGISQSYISQPINAPGVTKAAVRTPSPSDFTIVQDFYTSRADNDEDSTSLKALLKKKFKSVKEMAQYMLLMMNKYIEIKGKAPNGKVSFEQMADMDKVLAEIEALGKGDRPPVDTSSVSMIV